MTPRLTLAAVLLGGCAANTYSTGESELDERDAGRRNRDASTARVDAAGRDPETGDDPARGGRTVCAGERPHGCYQLTDTSPAGCPEQAPEIPLGLPPLNEWDFCNGGAVTAGASCVWEGREGGSANCLCDTGVHWLCFYL